MNKLFYRPEIDGLRAIAVLSVILYHSQMIIFGQDWFKGGYIGVDIFFVISGYLITRIILSELYEKKSFNFLNFYERRARRILPMLFVVIFASIPFAWKQLLPSGFIEYAQSILASLFFGSNFFFYFSTTEYGADSALLKPFLHTWSLGVEEQFYLLFPVIAIIAFKFFNKHLLTTLIALSIISLIFAEVMVKHNADLNFYLPFSRFWELAAGSILALIELNRKQKDDSTILNQALSIAGLILIIYSILSFNDATPHPSIQTLIPVLGVSLVIGFSSKRNLVGKFLGVKPVVSIGLISYSAYLWHFPIFAFSRQQSFDLSTSDKLELIALTFTLSIISYFTVEQFFRSKKRFSSKTFTYSATIFFVLIVVLACYSISTNGLIEHRYNKQKQEVISQLDIREYRTLELPDLSTGINEENGETTTKCNTRTIDTSCRWGDEELVFVGDSYIGAVQRAIIDKINGYERGFISLNYERCPFFITQGHHSTGKRCDDANGARVSLITKLAPPKLFFVTANVDRFVLNKKRGTLEQHMSKEEYEAYRNKHFKLAWEAHNSTITWLKEQGHIVVVIRTPPKPVFNSLGWLPNNISNINNNQFPIRYNKTDPLKLKSKDQVRYTATDVIYIDPSDYLCELSIVKKVEKDRCYDVHPKYGPIYNGQSHFSYNGASIVATGIKSKLISLGIIK